MESATHEIRQKMQAREAKPRKREWKKLIPLLGFFPVPVVIIGVMMSEPVKEGEYPSNQEIEAYFEVNTREMVNAYGRGQQITAKEYEDEWPWKDIDEAVLRCKPIKGDPSVSVELDGTVYALNGTAMRFLPRETHLRKITEYGFPFAGATDKMIQRGLRAFCGYNP